MKLTDRGCKVLLSNSDNFIHSEIYTRTFQEICIRSTLKEVLNSSLFQEKRTGHKELYQQSWYKHGNYLTDMY